MNSEGGDSIMNEETMIRRDRMRFTKNSLSANLAILAILFDVFFFISIYQSDVGTYYYNFIIGLSVIYNLVFMLAAFLSSEGVKNYKREYTYPLLILGVIQLVRIFIIPMKAHTTVLNLGGVDTLVMGDTQFFLLVAFLVISAACLFASAVVNFTKCNALEAHLKLLEEKSAEEAKTPAEKSV